jgi:uncharacterized protein (DUF302 family)
MNPEFDYTLESDKPFDAVTEALEKATADHQFRVLAVHDVQATLAEKGFERGPLKIIEICNAKFAHQALKLEPTVALFMPCRFAVYTENSRTIVKLARPTMIAQMMPDAGLEEFAAGVETTLKKVMADAV